MADFILQPYVLVRVKRHPLGMAVHAGIHGLVLAALVASFLPRWWLIVPLVTAAHYGIDWMKVTDSHTTGPVSFLLFTLDQAVHLLILALAVLGAGLPLGMEVWVGSRALTAVLYYAIPYIAVTFAGSIVIFQLALAFNTRPTPGILLLPAPRLAGALERALTLTAVLFLPPVLWWVGGVTYAVQLGAPETRQSRRWLESVAGLAFAALLGILFRAGAPR